MPALSSTAMNPARGLPAWLTSPPGPLSAERNAMESFLATQSGSLEKTADLRSSGASDFDIALSMLEGSHTSINMPAARSAQLTRTKQGLGTPDPSTYAGIESLARSGTNPFLNLEFDSQLVAEALDTLRTDPLNEEAHTAVAAHQFIANFDPTKSLLEQAAGIAFPLAAAAFTGVAAPSMLAAGIGTSVGTAFGGTSALATGATMASNVSQVLGAVKTGAQLLSGRDAPEAGEYDFLLGGGAFNPNSTTPAGVLATDDPEPVPESALSNTVQPEAHTRADTPFESSVGVVDSPTGPIDYYDEARQYTAREVDLATLAGLNLGELQPGERATGGLLASQLTTQEEWRAFQAEMDRLAALQPQPSLGRPRPVSNNPAPVREDPDIQAEVQETVQDIGLQTTFADTVLSDEDDDFETLLAGATFRRGAGGRALAGRLG